ncbi:hypothetical protein AC578_4845 [Pseudocercospora eumusae]|uniref:FAD-binding domain-containing protein n=1 Tax=Pseudocercospora eumusae TaxID=321146 RepID=A0A139HC44_9PEZI|nr:hypothetical protein AC578_4845 [Pseudocercospora eumusae]
MHTEVPFEVAIVGGGIVGATLAAGLLHRNIKFTIFEQARQIGEIGVGIGFTANTVRCMQKMNPEIVTCLRDAGAVPNDAFRYLDGYTQLDPSDSTIQEPLYMLDAGPMGWETVRRDLFLMQLVKRLPPDRIQLNKRLVHVERDGAGGKVALSFADGSTYSADALISCDGLKSMTRKLLLGGDDPASYPQYTHKAAYRTLLPKSKVEEAVGEYKASKLHFHLGPGAHVLHYPVNSTTIGAAVYVHDPNDWPLGSPLTAQGVREDVLEAVKGWSEPIQRLVALFPEKLEKWALFDMYEYPLRQYNWGRVALAGDAAHASSPHHGAGASFGIEDGLVLCTLLEEASVAVTAGQIHRHKALELAFQTYDEIRRTRTQWLVNSARRTCSLYQQEEWGDLSRKVFAQTCFEEVRDRSFKIWHFDSAQMVRETVDNYAARLHKERGACNGNGNGHINTNTNGSAAAPAKVDWLVQIPDHANVQEIRASKLSAHMSNAQEQLAKGKLIMGGPSLSTTGPQRVVTGSIQVIRAESAEECLGVLAQDPYAQAGVWNLSAATVQPMRVGVVKQPSGV